MRFLKPDDQGPKQTIETSLQFSNLIYFFSNKVLASYFSLPTAENCNCGQPTFKCRKQLRYYVTYTKGNFWNFRKERLILPFSIKKKFINCSFFDNRFTMYFVF